jgi:RNA polymerase primary sigma factor
MFLRRKENKYYPRISIDEPVFIDEDCILTLGDTLDNTYNMIEDVNDRMRLNSIYESFSLLTDREKEIMRLYFGIGCNPKVQSEIAAIYGMERSNVSRIVSKSIYKIRRDLVTRKLLDENLVDSNKCKRISNN